MAEVVNLRAARKRQARAEKARLADANRAKFGRTKVEKQAQLDEARRQAQLLNGAQRDRQSPGADMDE
ncbi:MAG: DUF4169 family protein [Sphingobium sp.]|nr:DUF4169 family protein [Sphingobium sp.]